MSPSLVQPQLIEQHTNSRAPVEPGREFRAAVAECAFYELTGWTNAVVAGADRTRWLNGMITNNIRDLPESVGIYAFLLTPQGRIQGDLYAYNCGDSISLHIEKSQAEKVISLLRRYIIMDKVQITETIDNAQGLAVCGPKSRQKLQSAGLELPELERLHFAGINWKDCSLTVIRSDHPCIESYEIWGLPDAINLLKTSLADASATQIGEETLDLLRIAQGIPEYGRDIRERDLPHETGQERALSFTKGCYIGQEIVERIRSRGNVHRRFAGFKVAGPLPPPGAKIQADGKERGEITSSAVLPLRGGNYSVALGYIRRELESASTEIDAAGAKLTITGLPFTEVFKD